LHGHGFVALYLSSGVHCQASNAACLAELNRYPLRGRIQLATIKFLEHILNANNSLVNKVYSSTADLENTEVPWEGSFYCVLTFHIWRLVTYLTSQVPHSVNLGWFYSLTTILCQTRVWQVYGYVTNSPEDGFCT
jgi:hypothetical protein